MYLLSFFIYGSISLYAYLYLNLFNFIFFLFIIIYFSTQLSINYYPIYIYIHLGGHDEAVRVPRGGRLHEGDEASQSSPGK